MTPKLEVRAVNDADHGDAQFAILIKPEIIDTLCLLLPPGGVAVDQTRDRAIFLYVPQARRLKTQEGHHG